MKLGVFSLDPLSKSSTFSSDALSAGCRAGPATMQGLMATRSQLGFCASTNAHAARSCSVFPMLYHILRVASSSGSFQVPSS